MAANLQELLAVMVQRGASDLHLSCGTYPQLRRARGTAGLASEQGMAILEVLIAGVILALAVVGIALMFSEGHSYVVAEGDDRVAIALAQQKLEAVRALGFSCIPIGGPGPAGVPMTAISGCADTTATQAARTYNEGPLGRYASRTVIVECANPDTMAAQACPSPVSARKITVDITPTMAKAKPLRVEAFVALH